MPNYKIAWHLFFELTIHYSLASEFSSAFEPIRFNLYIGANFILSFEILVLSELDKPSFSTVFFRVSKA